jgi:sulfatase maturation enzyme AslB (radical SAM superfamily)
MSQTHYSIGTAVLKVASPCNLNCTYCYEYNRGDDSWKSKPKVLALETARVIGHRVLEYAMARGLNGFQFTLHGGEPLLVGAKGIDTLIAELRASCSPLHLRFGMQTNGTLVTEDIATLLASHGVRVGVSIDGDIRANRLRVDHQGRGSWERAVAGIGLLKKAGCLSGIQAVIDLDSEPETVLDAIAAFEPPEIELGQPFGCHDNPPAIGGTRYSLGDWLSRAFDHWRTSAALAGSRITVLADAVRAVMTERSTSEWFASLPPGYIIIATDGAYEGLDTLKVVGTAGRVLGMSVRTHSIEEALEHPYIRMRATGPQLPTDCAGCSIAPWCSGGYYPSRYGRGRGFDNPTIYCRDMKVLFRHVAAAVAGRSGTNIEDKRRIVERLSGLSIDGRPIALETGGRSNA